MQNTLTSIWDGLNENLIASFYEVVPQDGDKGRQWIAKEGSPVVRAPLSESSLQGDLQWQSPFENAGAESKIPTLSSLLQNGAIQQYSDAIISDGGINQKLTAALDQFMGRTGITKLNSTQVFNGMPPIKINCTAHFRAWRDGAIEVEEPFRQLMQWALPKELSEDGSIIARLAEKVTQDKATMAETIMPSLCPSVIAMTYKGRTYSPLVIESIDFPMASQINKKGDYVNLAIQLTLCTLTAIDRYDWDNYKKL